MTMRVSCPLNDCVFFNKPSDPSPMKDPCDCAHPDISLSKDRDVCPLYKKDWMKAGANIDAIKAIGKRR